MQEVTNQILPLKTTVDRLDRTVRSLYRNGGEGAPGYLETAREIDNGRFDMIFNTLQEFKDALKPVTLFMNNQEQKEKDLAKGIKDTASKSARNLVILGLVFTAISLVTGNMQGCRNAAHSFFSADQPAHPALNASQSGDQQADREVQAPIGKYQ